MADAACMVVLDGDALFHARTLCDYSNHPAVMRRQEDHDKRRKTARAFSQAKSKERRKAKNKNGRTG